MIFTPAMGSLVSASVTTPRIVAAKAVVNKHSSVKRDMNLISFFMLFI
jgi:hypothetical protein